uniref:Peptidase S1 domain-containing protein n=1 Tax=Chelydra serpentina TaxID=8475 RepID=A0A8C3XKK9_CHESE
MLLLLLLPVAVLLPPRARAVLPLPISLPGEIIGGQEARPHSRPYMAFVSIETGEDGEGGSCGGFLIREDVVMTAAHCNCNLGDSASFKISVLLGAHNVKKKREPGRQKIWVRRQIPHPEFNDETLENDIMLLQLAKRAKRNKWVKTIALPHVNEKVKPGIICSVAGWGITEKKTECTPDTLQEVDVKVLDDDVCLKNPNMNYPGYNASTGNYSLSCSHSVTRFIAQGDSGGPLVCGETAQGIVSWGPKDEPPPGVYTRVSTFIPWIEAMMRKL